MKRIRHCTLYPNFNSIYIHELYSISIHHLCGGWIEIEYLHIPEKGTHTHYLSTTITI